MNKIIIHYPFVANYRIPVFNAIYNDKDIDLVVISALKSNDSTLLSEKNGWDFSHVKSKLRTFKIIRKQIDFETGVLFYLFKNRNNFNYYVILSNPNILSSWVYSLLAKLLGYKVVFWGHGLLKEDKGIKSYIRKLYYKIPNKFWLYGNRARSLMLANHIDDKKISVIYNSLDYENQKKLRDKKFSNKNVIRERYNINPDDFVFICIGRLLSKLEIDKLILLLPKVKELDLKPKLLIVGDGPEKENLHKLVVDNNLEHDVIFVGAVYDEETLSDYYIMSDLSVVMGVVGLAAMHSLAYGIPMITHSRISEHCPEIEAIIEGETGYFFEKNDDDSFLNKVIEASKSNHDLRDNCISTIESYYTPQKQVEFIKESLNDK